MRVKLILFIIITLFFNLNAISQVGIGTTTPNAKAVLDIKSTDKGVLFPRLTTTQRDAITNPPNGLHIYNSDESCMNFYDSVFATWSCYCEMDSCKVVFIRISANATNINFNTAYAVNYSWARKFTILVAEGVSVTGIIFTSLPINANYQIKITNRGNIYGQGGTGGNGASGQVGSCGIAATNGNVGGNAIATRSDIKITIDNFGIVAGGGGGGGGGGRVSLGQYGGGGGGGAGGNGGNGGIGGGNTISSIGCGTTTSIAQGGMNGTAITFGTGGTGASGGGNGGNGGGYALGGQNGSGTSPGTGGAAGKAIASVGGASNSIINNIGSGQTFGVVE